MGNANSYALLVDKLRYWGVLLAFKGNQNQKIIRRKKMEQKEVRF